MAKTEELSNGEKSKILVDTRVGGGLQVFRRLLMIGPRLGKTMDILLLAQFCWYQKKSENKAPLN